MPRLTQRRLICVYMVRVVEDLGGPILVLVPSTYLAYSSNERRGYYRRHEYVYRSVLLRLESYTGGTRVAA